MPLDQVSRRAAPQGGVLSRRQLYSYGVTRSQVRAHVAAQRWQRVGSQSLCLHTGPISQRGLLWAAVLEAGPRAHLDGASSLIAAGLANFTTERIRVSVPRGVRPRRARGVDIRQTRRFDVADLAEGRLPRTNNAVAATRAAMWARTDREAALILTMTVQQRLADADQLGRAMLKVRRDRRRRLIHAVIVDLLGGVRSLGELDLARECRRRGLPEPSRQVVRRGPRGTYYLDVVFEEWNVVVEVDGIHHSWAENVVADAERHNEIALRGAVVLRMPLLGLRVDPDTFFDQIRRALLDAGWAPDTVVNCA
jgi:very-short-patch-repair endonuclease